MKTKVISISMNKTVKKDGHTLFTYDTNRIKVRRIDIDLYELTIKDD